MNKHVLSEAEDATDAHLSLEEQSQSHLLSAVLQDAFKGSESR